MSVNRFGQISLFFPFEAAFGTPILHEAGDLARSKMPVLLQMTKGQ